jgi:hypothetical protein
LAPACDRWLTADPERLAASLLGFIGHPAYGLDALRADLDRFTVFLSGNEASSSRRNPSHLPPAPQTAVKTQERSQLGLKSMCAAVGCEVSA